MLIMNGSGAVMEFLQSSTGLFLMALSGFALIAAPEVIDKVRGVSPRRAKKERLK